MKIVTIIGARPQFIKAAVVSRAFAASKDVTEIIVHTGQHFDSNMSDIFFEEMCIPKPHYNLNLNSATHIVRNKFKILSNNILPSILPCQKIHLT